MTNPCITLQGVSCVLPDGRALFSDLDESFDLRHTGLVGRNGVGKSMLARMLAGLLQPSAGRFLRSGPVHYLAQQVTPAPEATVASLAGVRTTFEALARIEAGSCAVEDFEAVGERWDIRQRLQHELQRQGLGLLHASTPASCLSGGEVMRIALVGAWLAEADFLILDEPNNHLDRPGRQALIEQLQCWPRGLLVISHDRALLGSLQRIVELSSLGLRSYGGNYDLFTACKVAEQHSAEQHLERLRLERQRATQSMRAQHERQERRQASGRRAGKQANQAKILLGRQRERSEATAGKLHQQQADQQAQLQRQVSEAAQQLRDDAVIAMHSAIPAYNGRRQVARLDAVRLPFLGASARPVDLSLGGDMRVGVIGANGCGKSLLLKVLAGLLQPAAGTCTLACPGVYLDQRLASLDPQRTVLAQLQAVNRTASEGDLRMRLAQLGLPAHKVLLPSGLLSGGERLKAALACALYADPVPALLLLDEPDNHLDLPSRQALQAMLQCYPGALVVVSHDDGFLNELGLTHRLVAGEAGWDMGDWR